MVTVTSTYSAIAERKTVEMPKKRCKNGVRHCHDAVPIEKVSKGHMGQGVGNKLQNKLSTRKYNTKIVSTSHAFNGVSTN